MSSAESKRAKRRRNKRGGGNCRTTTASNTQQQTAAKGDGQVLGTIPVPSSLSDLDLDNIPQPLSQMPRSHNPYLDREHCLLCRRERPDPPANRIPPGVGNGAAEKENNGQLPITQMPLWLCPDCRRTVEQEEANTAKGFDPPAIGELLLPPTLPLITSLQKLDVAFGTPTSQGAGDGLTPVVTSAGGGGKVVGGGGDGGGGGGRGGVVGDSGPCQCEPCRERREIAAEQEQSRQQLGECWTELSHLVRCVYWEAGTSLTGEESTTKLSLPRMKELVHRLCAHDPHLLYQCLEREVEDFIKEMRERLLKQLAGGFRAPPLAKQFITMLLEEYTALCAAAQTLLSILGELEKEHLHKFNLTWPLHNKHLFHSLVYMEPGLHDNLGTLIKQLRAVAMQKEPYHEESYSSLLQRYLQFDNDMQVVAVVWRDCQQLIEDYIDEQELYKGKDALNHSWEVGVSSSRPRPLSCEGARTANSRNPYQCHSALIGHLANVGSGHGCTINHKGSSKKKCLCEDCSLNRLTSNLFTPDLYEEIGLKHLTEAAQGGQLSALDSYLQSIHPPDLSSTTSSSDCSSQGDSEEVIPIFSRTDLIHSGFSSPRSDDSDDSDDLDSESSPSPSHDNAFDDEEEEGETTRHAERRSSRGRTRCRAGKDGNKQNGGDSKKDSNISSNQPCECHVCAANHSGHLTAATMMTASMGDKMDMATKPSYLFYPNLGGNQPLDLSLSHHGITAKHPLIHPHLYNLSSQQQQQKPSKAANSSHPAHSAHPQQAFQLNMDAPDGLHAYSDWNSAYESAKLALHSRSQARYGHEDAPDLVQSALQSNNCRLEKSEAVENRSKVNPPHQQHQDGGHADGSEGKAQKEEGGKAKKHGSHGVSNVLGEWTKQQRAAHLAQHAAAHDLSSSLKGKSSGVIAQELCAKHNLPAVPKLPNNNLFFPSLLPQGAADLAGAGLSTEALAQQFSQGVQQALMTQGMLATHAAQTQSQVQGQSVGAGVQLQNAGIHVADVHHLQHQQQQQQQHQHHQHQHAHSNGGKKKAQSVEESAPAEPTVKLPDYLNEQHLQTCAHQNQGSHPSSLPGTNPGLCSSSMQTAASTPTSASVCSDPDYETSNYVHDDDTPSNYDDKDSNASSTTRERESKHCECCYCEFFGQGPQPAPTSRNYTEIRDRLRLRLRERKQPKDHSPTHEEKEPPRPPSDVLPSDDRKVEDLLTFIEGENKTKSSSKAAKRQRQRQKKAEEKTKKEPENGRKKETTEPMEYHHHHHHHHHQVEVAREKQQQEDNSKHKSSCKLEQSQQSKSLKQAGRTVEESAGKQAKTALVSSKGQPSGLSPATSQPSKAVSSASTTTTSQVASASAASKPSSASVKPSPSPSTQESQQVRARADTGSSSSSNKKGKVPQPQPQAQVQSSSSSMPSPNAGSKSKTKGKQSQSGAGKQGPALVQGMDVTRGKSEDALLAQPQGQEQFHNKQGHITTNGSNKQAMQAAQKKQVPPQKQQQQQSSVAQKEKTNRSSKQEDRNSWKGSAGQERYVNGDMSDSSSNCSSRSSSLSSGAKGINNGRNKQVGDSSHGDDVLSKKQQLKSNQSVQPTPSMQKATPPTPAVRKSNAPIHASNGKEHMASQRAGAEPPAPMKVGEAVSKLASKRPENNHHTKVDSHASHNGVAREQLSNGSALTNGNGSTTKRRKKKKNSDNPNASIDEIFLPKENADMNEMDETERELEAFKRFCMASTPQQKREKPKVVFNIKDLALKKSGLQAH